MYIKTIPLGTGDAVLKCQKFIKSKNFLMLLPDDLIIKKIALERCLKYIKNIIVQLLLQRKSKESTFRDGGFLN